MICISQTNYPHLGVDDPSFTRLAPRGEVAFWTAMLVSVEAFERGFFVGSGFTSLFRTFDFDHGRWGTCCEGGYVYGFHAEGDVLAVPSRNRGYSGVISDGEQVAFWNYSELVIISSGGECHYGVEVAVDDLMVTGIDARGVWVEGVFRHGMELEERFITRDDLRLING